jgi:Uma2 family endonuclease
MASSDAPDSSMTTASLGIALPDVNGYTTTDLHALPDDGRRWELIDGSLIVSPSATFDHNNIARWIAQIIEDSCPHDDLLVGTDQSTTIDDHNEPRPDIVVASAAFLRTTPFPLEGALLVAEVVSPTSVLRDTETKRALYARAGVPTYWIVVPEADEPAIRLAELALDESDGSYRYATHYTSDVFETQRPWPVRIDLPSLIARRARAMRVKPASP